MSKKIVLQIKNNTQAKQRVNLMARFSMIDNINSLTEYRFDVTDLTYAADTGELQVKQTGIADFTTVSFTLINKSLQGLVNALNTLNRGGTWFTYVSGGRTYVAIYSDMFVFGTLNYGGVAFSGVSLPFYLGNTPNDLHLNMVFSQAVSGVVTWESGVVNNFAGVTSIDFTHTYSDVGHPAPYSGVVSVNVPSNLVTELHMTHARNLDYTLLNSLMNLNVLDLQNVEFNGNGLPSLEFAPIETFILTNNITFTDVPEMGNEIATLKITGTSITTLPNVPALLQNVDISNNYFGDVGIEFLLSYLVNNGLSNGYLKIGYQQGNPVTLNSASDGYANTLTARGWTIVFTP